MTTREKRNGDLLHVSVKKTNKKYNVYFEYKIF